MRVYFVDANKRYIGNRELKDGEAIPVNATTTPVTLAEGKEAHFVDGAWVITDIPENEVETPVQAPTVEERLEATELALMDIVSMIMMM